MDIILIAGMWLDGGAWDEVVPALTALGHRPVPLTLPGQGDGNAQATLDDQVDAVVAAIDAAEGKVLLVGHSAACTIAWLGADRRTDRVAKVVIIGGFPQSEGQPYFAMFEPRDAMVEFPGWEPFAGPDSDDLDADLKASIARSAVAVPASVTHAPVHYTSEERYAIPVVMVCPEYSVADARAWVEGGETPELEPVTNLRYVDIDSGHWPMFSKPGELASLLAAETE